MSVLIGIIEQPIKKPESTGWDTNKIGGIPIWPQKPRQPQLPIAKCRVCGRCQSLVAQLYCPLGGSAFHRCLYIFVCPGQCSTQPQGWRVFRCMQYDAAYDKSQQGHKTYIGTGAGATENMDVDSWADGADDWGDGGDDWGQGEDDWEEDKNKSSCPTGTGEATLTNQTSENVICDEAGAVRKDEIIKGSAGFSEGTDRVSLESQDADVTKLISENFSTQINLGNNSTGHGTDEASACVSQVTVADTNTPQVIQETMLPTDSGRLDAMVKILNMKHDEGPQRVQASTSAAVVFQPYYLEVVEEPRESSDVSDQVLRLMRDYEQSEGLSISSMLNERPKSGKGKRSNDGENYEKSELRHGDRMFHKFLKRLQRCPQQCVRYDRGGDPLLVNDIRDVLIDCCPVCGGERVFELQMLPALIPQLQPTDADVDVDVDFSTVLIFTCSNNCWPSRCDSDLHLLEEAVILQVDPDRHLYR
ncbi:programmed cell death protein 2-like [Plakobranchus ocellatus]|uniref:Programmed cell death protein 2-like n=1 Tax=Plakobranchus ocellatus TaxID=259542 RepID=A0AAV3YKN1_9GAST|nr:programmed cell death protein 2-like [Plakobranchus ocellatus]